VIASSLTSRPVQCQGISYAKALSINDSVMLVKPSATCSATWRHTWCNPVLGGRVVSVARAPRRAKATDAPPLSRDDFVAWGKASVRARMRELTPDERSAIARNAALARWAKEKTKRKFKVR
jgi:hypothetical protein